MLIITINKLQITNQEHSRECFDILLSNRAFVDMEDYISNDTSKEHLNVDYFHLHNITKSYVSYPITLPRERK